MAKANPKGRPPTYTDKTVLFIRAEGRYKLQAASDRRAVINLMMDNKGQMTLGAINKHFDFDMKGTVVALIKNGWLQVKE